MRRRFLAPLALPPVLGILIAVAEPARAQASEASEAGAGADTDAGTRSPSPSPSCRPEARITVNLPTWKNALRRADTERRRAELLSELKLTLEPSDDDADSSVVDEVETEAGPGGSGSPQVRLLGIDDFVVPLGSAPAPDHVIQVRYGEARERERGRDLRTSRRAGDEAAQGGADPGQARVYLIQVLRPLGGSSWCALGSELSRREEGASRLETYALGFVHLLNARTQAIEIEIVESQLRHNGAARQYWIADGFKLRKVFDQEIGGMENLDDGQQTVARTGKLTLAGAFPRRIELTQITKRTTCDAGSGDSACDDKEQATSRTFMYNGRNYVTRK